MDDASSKNEANLENPYESPLKESASPAEPTSKTRPKDRTLAVFVTALGSTVAFFGTCLPGGIAGIHTLKALGVYVEIDQAPSYILCVSAIALFISILVGIYLWRNQPRVPDDTQEHL